MATQLTEQSDDIEPVEERNPLEGDEIDEESQIKILIAKGKEQGFLTYHEVNEHLPDEIVDPEQIEDIINMINDMGIEVHESPPDLGALMSDNDDTSNDDTV